MRLAQNSVKKMLQILISRIRSQLQKPSATSIVNLPKQEMSSGHIYHYVYLCNPSGPEANEMEMDESIFRAADELLEFHDLHTLIPIPSTQNDPQSIRHQECSIYFIYLPFLLISVL